jgi:WD40 repeat protein
MLKNANGTITKIAETKAWNWQQGCMLQWYPGKDDQLLFNDYDQDKDQYISKVINTTGKLTKTYPIPVNNVSKCGTFALSLNYDRLAKMRPDYGYFNKKDQTLPSDDEDGIWYLDLKTGDFKLIVSLHTLKNLKYTSTMEGAEHKVNHIDINPDGSRFMFLHRWIGPKGRFMRLITAAPDGTDLSILNGDIMTSHCCWLNNKEILSFCEHKGKRGYFKFYDKSDMAHLFSTKMPIVDGHPSISPNGRYVITDTYPDKARISSLFLYNMKTDEMMKLGRFFQPLKYKGEMRIDLHPKWSKDGKNIFFESGHAGNRRLFSLDIMI